VDEDAIEVARQARDMVQVLVFELATRGIIPKAELAGLLEEVTGPLPEADGAQFRNQVLRGL
jgi:hypothetical protein